MCELQPILPYNETLPIVFLIAKERKEGFEDCLNETHVGTTGSPNVILPQV